MDMGKSKRVEEHEPLYAAGGPNRLIMFSYKLNTFN
jgi:hypothetical protein